jgi:hypothetical protein
MNTLLFCVLLLAASAPCAKCCSDEQLLVGTWGRVERQSDHTQTAIDLTLTKDGRYFWAFRGKPPVLSGQWRLDGQNLITTVEIQAKDSGLPLLPRQITYQIVRVTEHELVIADGTGAGRWIRVR